MEQPTINLESPEETPEKTLGRRELLKALAAAGSAVAATSLLPGEWAKPVVEVGVLPAHAQVSEGQAPTPTSRPQLLSITTCSTAPIPPAEVILGDSTVRTFAVISAARSGIQLRRTMTAQFPTPNVFDSITGPTDPTGTWTPPDFPLPNIQMGNGPTDEFLTVLWEFVDPNVGVNTCVNHVFTPPL